MAEFEIQHFRVDEVCLYLISYGEYNDGADTADRRLEKWEHSGYSHLVRYMSADCCNEEECSFTWQECELCGETGITGHRVVALIPK